LGSVDVGPVLEALTPVHAEARGRYWQPCSWI
jgi:hypothetical protein